MAIKDKRPFNNLRRKANQAWEMAGSARADGDHKDAARWTEEARRLDQLTNEIGLKE